MPRKVVVVTAKGQNNNIEYKKANDKDNDLS